MNRIITVLVLCISLLGCATLSLNPYANEDAKIYEWVKTRMKITKNYPRPKVNRITQKELGQLFKKKLSKKTYKRWVDAVGEKEAAEYLQNIVTEIRGTFVVEDTTLYIANDVRTLVYRKGIIAHEYTHYLQQKSLGIVDLDMDPEGIEYFRREMEGTKIEKEYIKHICPKCDENGVIKEGN